MTARRLPVFSTIVVFAAVLTMIGLGVWQLQRKGEKEAFEPADAVRYNERTVAERSNARLKDEFGARCVRVQGGTKVMGHLMFGVLALSADQLMRLRQ